MSSTKKVLFFLILATLVFEISKFYSFAENYSDWQYSDWLINYEGGFVRRGFIGEILYFFHKSLFHKIKSFDLKIKKFGHKTRDFRRKIRILDAK